MIGTGILELQFARLSGYYVRRKMQSVEHSGPAGFEVGTMALAKTTDLKGLRWPVPAIDLTGDDVPVRLDKLLQSLQLLGTDDDRETTTATGAQAWKADTPPSLQVIKSGSLAITKTSIGWVKNIGGITGLLAAVAGVVSPFIEQVGEAVTVTLIASAALILSSVAIALSLLVKGDLDSRGVATAARHQGRADVAAAFLTSTAAMPARKAPAREPSNERSLLDDFLEALRAYPDKVRVTTATKGTPVSIRAIWREMRSPELRLLVGDPGAQEEIGLNDITGFTTEVLTTVKD